MTRTHLLLIRLAGLWFCLAAFTGRASAQEPLESAVAHVGVGAGVNFYNPSSNDGKSANGLAIAYRWHSFHSGWGPTFGLDFHSNDFTQPLGSITAPLGSLRMRAVLAGIGHTQRFGGRFSASGSVTAGYSFNHLSMDSGAGLAFARAGTPLIAASVNDSAIGKPEVSLWYDVFRHIGVGVSAAYLFARPEEVITTAAGSNTRHLNANSFELTAGVTVGVWKKPR
jgi:hypothetical protein